MDEIASECEQLLEEGVPLLGACLYPILGMPEWHRQADWIRMGLWDLLACKATGVEQGKLMRVPNNAAMAAFSKARRLENLPRLMSVPAGPHYGDLSPLGRRPRKLTLRAAPPGTRRRRTVAEPIRRDAPPSL